MGPEVSSQETDKARSGSPGSVVKEKCESVCVTAEAVICVGCQSQSTSDRIGIGMAAAGRWRQVYCTVWYSD